MSVIIKKYIIIKNIFWFSSYKDVKPNEKHKHGRREKGGWGGGGGGGGGAGRL